jgi:hypothetical protein
MLVSESSAMHQLRRRSAQKLHLDLIADRMPPRTPRSASAKMINEEPTNRKSFQFQKACILIAKNTSTR